MSAPVLFRPARMGQDEPGIAAVHWAARRLAYRDLLPRENLDGRTLAVLTEEWVGILGRQDGAETLVAEEGGAVLETSPSFGARPRQAPQDEEGVSGAPVSPPHPEVRGEAEPRRKGGVLTDEMRAAKERTRFAEPAVEFRILGFVTGGPVRERTRPITGNLSGVTAEVSLLYVLPERMGEGIGRALFGRSVQRLARQGHEALVVWGHRDNPYLRFYARLGGVAAAESDWEVAGRLFPTRAYVWRDLKGLVASCASFPSPFAGEG